MTGDIRIYAMSDGTSINLYIEYWESLIMFVGKIVETDCCFQNYSRLDYSGSLLLQIKLDF